MSSASSPASEPHDGSEKPLAAADARCALALELAVAMEDVGVAADDTGVLIFGGIYDTTGTARAGALEAICTSGIIDATIFWDTPDAVAASILFG